MKLDNITFWIFFGFWPLWLVWELVVLYLRGKGITADLISMEARQQGHKLNIIPFLWASMMAHFWFNWARPYSVPYPAILFWVLVVLTLAADWYFWKTPYDDLTGFLRIYRWPGTQAILGLVLGVLLFPQKDLYRS